MHSLLTDRVATPIGEMCLVARDNVLLLLEFEDAKDRVARELAKRFADFKLQPCANPFGLTERVRAYFDGDLASINDIMTDGGGSGFERTVWQELRTIPAGTTVSYGEVAKRLGDANLMRAVGLANGRNSIAIVVPCHRVIGADGKLTGYGGGLPRKAWLLKHEGALLL